MKYTEEQLKFLLNKKPELKKKPEPCLNTAVVEFLKTYRIYVKLLPTKAQEVKEHDVSEVLTVSSEDNVGLNYKQVNRQTKQKATEEWTKWKNWALDHKDFPKFQTDFFNKIYEYNENIDKKIDDPYYQRIELDPLIVLNEKKGKLIKRLVHLFLALFVGGAIISSITIFWEVKNDKSYPIFRN